MTKRKKKQRHYIDENGRYVGSILGASVPEGCREVRSVPESHKEELKCREVARKIKGLQALAADAHREFIVYSHSSLADPVKADEALSQMAFFQNQIEMLKKEL